MRLNKLSLKNKKNLNWQDAYYNTSIAKLTLMCISLMMSQPFKQPYALRPYALRLVLGETRRDDARLARILDLALNPGLNILN